MAITHNWTIPTVERNLSDGVDQEQIEAANEAKIDAQANPVSASGVPWA